MKTLLSLWYINGVLTATLFFMVFNSVYGSIWHYIG